MFCETMQSFSGERYRAPHMKQINCAHDLLINSLGLLNHVLDIIICALVLSK